MVWGNSGANYIHSSLWGLTLDLQTFAAGDDKNMLVVRAARSHLGHSGEPH